MTPHLTDLAQRSCDEVLPPLVEKSWRKLAKRVRHLSPDSPARDWHRTRIAAKRSRYSADAVAATLGKRTKALGAAVGQMTDVLGDQHDAVVAQETLESLANDIALDAATGYALGLLSATEHEHDMRLRRRARTVWPRVVAVHDAVKSKKHK